MRYPQITQNEIDHQIKRVCERFGPDTELAKLLVYLEKKYRVPQDDTATNIIRAFFEELGKTLEPESTADRALAGRLRKELRLYYADERHTLDRDPISITLPPRGYEPIIQRRKSAGAPASDIAEATKGVVSVIAAGAADLEYIGNNREAIERIASRIPFAARIEDTTVRWNEAKSHYGELKTFVAALRKSGAKFRSITGTVQDDSYVSALRRAFTGRKDMLPDQVKCFRLKHAAPLMNFLLLYEKDPRTGKKKRIPEVFFGYGTQHLEQTNEETAVFYSTDERLAKEFMRLFKVLRTEQFSAPISIESQEFLISRPRNCDVLATFKDGFPRVEVLERIAACHTRIAVCTTAWPLLDDFKSQLRAALKRGCEFDLALWEKSDDPFVQLRSETVGDPDDLKASMEANKIVLKAFQNFKKFKVHWCKGQGSVTVFWIDDFIYFSPYWVGDYASHGVHFLVPAGSDTGGDLIKQFELMSGKKMGKQAAGR